MKHILLNLKSLFKRERLIAIILLLCIFSTAIVLNFAYGLYQNFSSKKVEDEVELSEILPTITEGSTMTKGDLQKWSQALSTDTLNAMTVIYGYTNLDGFNPENYGSFYMRFTIHNGQFDICSETKEAYESQHILTSGRYISSQEEATGALVALVGTNGEEWTDACKALQCGENKIKLFNQEYEVIGSYEAGSTTPIVPFLTVPDDLKIDGFGIYFKKNITRAQYEELLTVSEEVLPGVLEFGELQFPDIDSIKTYNNMIGISAFISIISALDFSMLFLYIIKRRKKSLSIYQVCGCTKNRIIRYYLMECFLLTVPIYWIGVLAYNILLKYYIQNQFEYIYDAYSPKIYFIIFAVYLAFLILISGIFIILNTKKQIVTNMKER